MKKWNSKLFHVKECNGQHDGNPKSHEESKDLQDLLVSFVDGLIIRYYGHLLELHAPS